MSSPQQFLIQFRHQLREAGVSFALTSGQACVHYGIQQTTKDSDWIIIPDDLEKLNAMLIAIDASKSQRVTWRAICGTPLAREYLGNGWTSHLAIVDGDGETHHLDFFGKPPRVQVLERDPFEPDYASKMVVAQMKKTDREKDWPFVAALGRQAVMDGDLRGVLHGQDVDWLIETWSAVPNRDRDDLTVQRPLLALVETEPGKLRRAIAIERQYWQSVNRYRHKVFQNEWKKFFRRWRLEERFQWPTDESFFDQSSRLNRAAEAYDLTQSPFDEPARLAADANAKHDVAEIFAATNAELKQIIPPMEVVLP